MPAAALITGLAGLASGIASNAFGQSNATKSFERQKELMRLQNQYAVENWSRENTYNTPQAQMQRLKAAGLNPNLVYGSGSVGLDTTSGAISGPAAPAAPMAQTTPLSNSAMDAVNAAVGLAQAKKAGSETIAQDIENRYLSASLQERIKSVALQNNWTDQQTNKAVAETSNLVQQFGLLVAQQNILSTDRQIREKELAKWDERFRKEMRAFDDQHNLSKEEYRRLYNTYDDFIRLTKANSDKAEYDALLQELIYNSDKDFKNFERSTGILSPFISMLMRCFGR